MTVTPQERPIFENEEWLVMPDGLEHKTTGYFIERDSIGQRREGGLWSWPLHMAEKSWCAIMPFAEAFSRAASLYNVEADAELMRTFRMAHSEASPCPQVKQALRNPAPEMLRTLRKKRKHPISPQAHPSEKSLKDEGFRKLGDSWHVHGQAGARLVSKSPRIRSKRDTTELDSSADWQVPYRIRRTGTKLVRRQHETWNIR